MKSLTEYLKKNEKIILFIDEIHTIIGPESASGGALDASNLLKPALAKGDIRCIEATTYKEYRQIFEKIIHCLEDSRKFKLMNQVQMRLLESSRA